MDELQNDAHEVEQDVAPVEMLEENEALKKVQNKKRTNLFTRWHY